MYLIALKAGLVTATPLRARMSLIQLFVIKQSLKYTSEILYCENSYLSY
jgi:hypothetical protein